MEPQKIVSGLSLPPSNDLCHYDSSLVERRLPDTFRTTDRGDTLPLPQGHRDLPFPLAAAHDLIRGSSPSSGEGGTEEEKEEGRKGTTVKGINAAVVRHDAQARPWSSPGRF